MCRVFRLHEAVRQEIRNLERQFRILGGTALGLWILSAPIGAFALDLGRLAPPVFADTTSMTPYLLAQDEGEGGQSEELLKKKLKKGKTQPPPAQQPAREPAPA